MKNKKDREKINGKKMIDTIIEYLKKNEDEIIQALEIVNLQGEEKEKNIALHEKKPRAFRDIIANLVLIATSLPDYLIEDFYSSDEEFEKVLYEE